MKFILAPDSFKESMSAVEVCAAMEHGIKKIMPEAECIKIPLADGGEGFMRILVNVAGGKIFHRTVTGPLGEKVTGMFAVLKDGETGVVELASASGLQLVPSSARNPMITTSYGTGELIKAVLSKGIKKLVIGIGGSATNDGGAGIAKALGIKFFDKNGKEIKNGGAALADLEVIDDSGLITKGMDIEVMVAYDVTNPLTGTNGASKIYGSQKGATDKMITTLDKALHHYAKKIKAYTGKDVEQMKGAGAAGGAGAGLVAFLNAKLMKGIDVIMQYSLLENKIQKADYILTGEGSIDKQTIYGKTIAGVARLANKYNKPVIAFAGRVTNADLLCRELKLSSVFCILQNTCGLQDALQSGKQNLENTVTSVVRIIKASRAMPM